MRTFGAALVLAALLLAGCTEPEESVGPTLGTPPNTPAAPPATSGEDDAVHETPSNHTNVTPPE